MHNEPKHMATLQIIETAIISVYRKHPNINDHHVFKCIDTVINYYKAKINNNKFTTPELEPVIETMYQNVIMALEKTKTEEDLIPKRRSFSRALAEPSKDEIFLACARKIEKSVKTWNQQHGERGYLSFVNNYIP